MDTEDTYDQAPKYNFFFSSGKKNALAEKPEK
jgi:hypothetical protein